MAYVQYAPVAPLHQQQGYGYNAAAPPQMLRGVVAANDSMPSPHDPVRLASRADVAKIHQLLVTSSRKALRATLSDAPEQERAAAERDLDARVGEVMSMLLASATFGGGDGTNSSEDDVDVAAANAAVAAAAEAAASVPADAELAALEAEAEARAARVASLRAAAPRALRAALAQSLAAEDEREAKKVDERANKTKDDDDGEDSPPPPAPLGASFSSTLQLMPGLRARVEEAADRLERAVEAMEAEASAPSSGMTADLYHFVGGGRDKIEEGGEGEGDDDGAPEEDEGAAAARALAAHARACLPR